MSSRFLIAAATCLLCALATPAFADLTLFLGVNPTPERRTVKGVSLGTGLLVVGFEFEYASTSEDEKKHAPRLQTGMANVLLQTPIPIHGFQFYGTVGGGLYREVLHETNHRATSFGSNVGGGTKVTLTGPLRARFDYRLFNLRGSPLDSKVHRFYAGLNLAF
jgi:opacity protein-like surface antigen